VDRAAFGKASQVQKTGVDQVGFPVQDQVRQNLAGRGRVHDAMAAKAVGTEEARDFWDFAEDGVVIRRHFVEASPGTFGIDRKILKYWNTIGGSRQNFLDERRLEISFVAGAFFGVVPGEEKASGFGAEVETVGHIDDHGRGVRELVERFGGDQHAAEGLDGEIDADHFGDAGGPGSGGVDNVFGGDSAVRCFDFECFTSTLD